jgi:nitroreductase
MNTEQSFLLNTIRNRRTVFPSDYSDKLIKKEDIEVILDAAIWAPNHGNTEPWRFDVFVGNSKLRLSELLLETYTQLTKDSGFNSRKYDNLKNWPQKTPCIIAVSMKRGNNAKIPKMEESRAVSCAIQNMLLMSTSLGISSYWSTGSIVYSNAVKGFLNLADEDEVIGLIYFGYAKEPVAPKNRTPFSQLTNWHHE